MNLTIFCNIIYIHSIGKVERVVSDLLRLDAGGGLDYQVTAHCETNSNQKNKIKIYQKVSEGSRYQIG